MNAVPLCSRKHVDDCRRGISVSISTVEELLGGIGKRRWIKTRQAVHDAVGGQDDQAVRVHVDEGHHYCGFGELRLRKTVGVVFGP